MTGLEKMISDIEGEAKAAAHAVIEGAKKNARGILEKAKALGEEKSAGIYKQSDAEVADYLSRAKSAAVLQKRKSILNAKQEIINDVIDRAKKSLYDLSEDKYFEILLDMIKKFAPAQNGEICFSAADAKRLPADFEKTINKALQDKNAQLVISKETREIGGGFVLVYGGVEENCSFDALFDSAREALQDKVNEVLFK